MRRVLSLGFVLMLMFVCVVGVTHPANATTDEKVTGVTWESTDTTVTLTWDEYPGATSYGVQIYVDESNEPYFEGIAQSDTTSVTIDGFYSNSSYTLRVLAVVDGQWPFPNSEPVTVKTKVSSGSTISRTIDGLTATATDTTITLSWDPYPGTTLYHVNNASGNYVAETETNSITITCLEPNTTYEFYVLAEIPSFMPPFPKSNTITVSTKEVGYSSPDDENKISGVTWEATDTVVTIKWDPYPGTTSYSVYNLTDDSIVRPGICSVTLVNLKPNTVYEFYIYAHSSDFTSPLSQSNLVSIKTNEKGYVSPNDGTKVTGVTWESTDTTVTIAWDEFPGATSYGVQYYKESYLDYEGLARSDNTSVTIEGFEPGSTYTLRVWAMVENKLPLLYSDPITVKTKPSSDSTEIPPLTNTAEVYTDVKPKSWFKSAVDYVVSYGLMNGTSIDKFEPNTPMSRAMLVTVLWRLEGEPTSTIMAPFGDLKQAWYKDAVIWAYENNIVKGTSVGTFSPNGNVTREQMATILYRYSKFKGEDTTARTDISAYPDAKKVSKYARDAISWANASGLITGTAENGKTILAPRVSATRAQVATILMRYTSESASAALNYDTFSGTIGEYKAHNLAYTDWKGDTEQAAFIEVYSIEKGDHVLENLAMEFEKVYSFAPSLDKEYYAKSTCEELGTYFVEGYSDPQTVCRYTITDKTYIYITNDMYKVYTQVCDDGSYWVGYCIYATMDTVSEERSKPEVRALTQEMRTTFEKLIGLSLYEMYDFEEELELMINYISQAGTVRSVHSDGLVDVLYIYCRGLPLEQAN